MIVNQLNNIAFSSSRLAKTSNARVEAKQNVADIRNVRALTSVDHLKANFVPFLGQSFKTLSNTETNFNHVGGLYNAKEAFRLLKETIENPESKYILPKAYLLSGPNGSGKTLLLRALAGELEEINVPVVYSSAADLNNSPVRNAQLTKIYEFAKEKAAESDKKVAILAIEDIEDLNLLPSNDSNNPNKKLSQFNELLDSLENIEDTRVIIIGTTSKDNSIDDSIKNKVLFLKTGIPQNQDERFEVLEAIANKNNIRFGKITEKNEENKAEVLRDLADSTRGYSAADLATVLISAHNKAQAANRAFVESIDVKNALLDNKFGPVTVDNSPEWYFKISIAHELGHSVIRHIMDNIALEDEKPWARPQGVEVINFNSRNGTSASVVLKNPGYITKSFEYIFAEQASNYGGLAAEYLLNNGHHAGGPANDISVNTGLLDDAVSILGMGKETGLIKPGKSYFAGLFNDSIAKDEKALSQATSGVAFSIVNFYREFIQDITEEYSKKARKATPFDEPLSISGEDFDRLATEWINADPKRLENFNKLKDHIRSIVENTKPEMPKIWDPVSSEELSAKEVMSKIHEENQ